MNKFLITALLAATAVFAAPRPQAFMPEATASQPVNGTRLGQAGTPVMTVVAATPTVPNASPLAPSASVPLSLITSASVVASSLTPNACSALSTPSPMGSSASTLPEKPVVVQHLVMNTETYTLADWKEDITNASSIGFDGFALQIGNDTFMPDQVALAYRAFEEGNTTRPFGVFLQLDMLTLPCNATADIGPIVSVIQKYASHPNTTLVEGRPLLSTFSGSTCRWGENDPVTGWAAFKHSLNNNVHFVPDFLEDPSTGYAGLDCIMDGAYNSAGAFPLKLVDHPPKDVAELESFLNTDAPHAAALQGTGKTFMSTISMWMSAHYGPGHWNGNFIHSSDQWLVDTRIHQLLKNTNGTGPDIIQLLSWNDYTSSNYISRVKGTLPPDTVTVAGMGHNDGSGGWQLLFRLYVPLYKTGVEPTVVRESMIMWARTHPADAIIPGDTVGRPRNANSTADALWGLVFLREPATILLQTGDNSPAHAFDLPAGINTYTAPLTPSGYINNTLVRDGKQLYTYRNLDYKFDANPTIYNFNAFVMSN